MALCKLMQQYTYHSPFTHVCIVSERIQTHCGRVQHLCIRFLWQSFHSHGKCEENVLSVCGKRGVCSVSFFTYIIVSKNECAAFYLIWMMYVKVHRNWFVELVSRVTATPSAWRCLPYLPTLEYSSLVRNVS
jgi:hypothetical protein